MMSCDTVQFSDMVAENKAVRCVLKFKVTTKGIWNVLEGSEDMSRKVNSGKRKPEASLDGQRSKNRKTDLSKDKPCGGTEGQRQRVSIGGSKPPEVKNSVKPSMTVMDRGLKLECSKILRDLMNHSLGWAFSQPVDPVKLKIPDYFEIIKNPMDLGTIKQKLEGNMYPNAKAFADDVKLTFENAKSYNPPSHDVHRWAETLDANFNRRWKLLDTRLKLAKKNDEGAPVGFTKAPSPVKLNTRRISPEERQKSKPGPMQVKPGKTALNGCSSLNKTAEKEHCSRRTSSSANLRQSIDSTKAKCSSCVSWTCCCPKNCAVQTSASDISSERSSEHNHYGDSKLDREVKSTLASLANNFALDSDGHEERSPHSTSATPPVSVEGWMADVEMSPRKALRAARLKSRFADTIFRATHPAQVHGEKSDLSSIQQERLRLEKEQLKEKARIEAQIKAAEAASRRKEQDDLMIRRERERKAARMALEKMEKTVDLDKTASILKDLEMLFGLPVRAGYPDAQALERLGLYMKDKYLEEDEDAILNGEEGEILS